MPKKIKDCTWDYLTGIPLPVHADTYTVISHENCDLFLNIHINLCAKMSSSFSKHKNISM